MYDVKAPSGVLTCWRQAPTNWPCAAGDGEAVGVAGAAVGVEVGVDAGVGVGVGEQAPKTAAMTTHAASALKLGMPAKGSESPKSSIGRPESKTRADCSTRVLFSEVGAGLIVHVVAVVVTSGSSFPLLGLVRDERLRRQHHAGDR